MKISPAGIKLIKSFESFVPYVYDDLLPPVNGRYREWDGSKPKGTLTIGYGHTNAAKHPLRIKQHLRITESEAVKVLDVDLDECEDAVNKYVKVPITQGQFDALVSFTFNCGVGNLKKLIVPLNDGDPDGTRAKFDLYKSSKGKVLRGLVRRRDAEQSLWDSDPTNIILPRNDDPYPVPKTQEPTVPAPSKGDKLSEILATISAVVAPIISALADWRVAAVVGTFTFAGLITFFVLKRKGYFL